MLGIALAGAQACAEEDAGEDDGPVSTGDYTTAGPTGGGVTCTDDCDYSGDGVCDDGGPGSEYAACELGTDCTDCGSRGETSGSSASSSSGGPMCSYPQCAYDGMCCGGYPCSGPCSLASCC